MRFARRQVSILATILTLATLAIWFQRWSLDGVQGTLLTALLHQDTAYAAEYTDRAFRSVRIGMNEGQVQSLLGPPIGIRWTYRAFERCVSVYVRNGKARSWVFDECVKLGVRDGLPADEVEHLLGTPDEAYWFYSESPGDTNYRERVIRFSKGQAIEVIKGWYLD